MLPKAVQQYIREIERVLTPGGKCFISWFWLNEESRELHSQHQSILHFKYQYEGYYAIDEINREAAVAFDESEIDLFYSKAGVEITGKYPRNWCGRGEGLVGQDVVLAQKPLLMGYLWNIN